MASLVIAVRARIYRDGLANAIGGRAGLTTVAVVSNAIDTLTAVQSCAPDVVLVDVTLEGAFELIQDIRAACATSQVVALAVADDEATVLNWAEAGAAGFVTSDNSIDELFTCIDAVVRGELACSRRLAAALLRRVAALASTRSAAPVVATLTPRQADILSMIRRGMTNKQIARELAIELPTVKNHVHQLLRRLQVRHRRDAAALPASAHRLAQLQRSAWGSA